MLNPELVLKVSCALIISPFISSYVWYACLFILGGNFLGTTECCSRYRTYQYHFVFYCHRPNY